MTNEEILRALAKAKVYWIPPSEPDSPYVEHGGSLGLKVEPFTFDFGPDNRFYDGRSPAVQNEFIRRCIVHALSDGANAIRELKSIRERLNAVLGEED